MTRNPRSKQVKVESVAENHHDAGDNSESLGSADGRVNDSNVDEESDSLPTSADHVVNDETQEGTAPLAAEDHNESSLARSDNELPAPDSSDRNPSHDSADPTPDNKNEESPPPPMNATEVHAPAAADSPTGFIARAQNAAKSAWKNLPDGKGGNKQHDE